MSRPLPYGRHEIIDDDIDAVVACLRGEWLTQGPTVAAFERALCDVTGAPFAVATSSGTAALHLAGLALGLENGDMGVTAAVTFLASANAVRYAGGDIAFADVEADTGLVDVEDLSRLVDELCQQGRPPKVLIPVDLTGQPADLAAVRSIADRCGARVIEDAAHSLGATYTAGERTYRSGSCAHADAAVLSFHPVKHVTTAEGGAVLTSDEGVYARLLELRSHGMHKDPARLSRGADDPMVGPWYYEMEHLGFNFRLSDLQCALGLSQLRRLDGFLERRRAIANAYDRALATSPLRDWLRPLRRSAGRESAFHLYVVQVRAPERDTTDDRARVRKHLYNFLRERGIFTQVHYVPVPWQPYYRRHGYPRESYPGAEAYYAASLSLPIFAAMTVEDTERVIFALQEWTESADRGRR